MADIFLFRREFEVYNIWWLVWVSHISIKEIKKTLYLEDCSMMKILALLPEASNIFCLLLFFSPSFLIEEWNPFSLGSFRAVIKCAMSEKGHWKVIQISTSTTANFMPPCIPMLLFIKVLLNVSCCRKDQKCYITCYISAECSLYFYFFGAAIWPEKM